MFEVQRSQVHHFNSFRTLNIEFRTLNSSTSRLALKARPLSTKPDQDSFFHPRIQTINKTIVSLPAKQYTSVTHGHRIRLTIRL